MADGIADQVSEGLGNGIENPFIEIGILSGDVDLDVAAALPRHIAHHAREAAK